MAELAPVGERERIVTLDVLRGLALCGVLIGNLYMLYSGRWLSRPVVGGTHDVVAAHVIGVLVEGKAQNLLTFLFGFGFAAQLVRATARGEPVVGLYVRRMLALLFLGWCHVALLWWGDVTWGYAISGFALLLFLRVPNPVRLALGIALAIVPYTIYVAVRGGPWTAGVFGLGPAQAMLWSAELRAAIAGSDHGDLVFNQARYALLFSAPIWSWYAPALIGRFLLGYAAGAGRWFEREGADHLRMFRWFAGVGFAVGLPLAGVAIGIREKMIELPRWLSSGLHMIELLAMATAYLGGIVLLMQRPRARRILLVLAPCGRMPLTTYVLQSVFCTALFYGWGLGWATPGAAACLGLALGIYAVQVVLAGLWLRRYRLGPLEWVWRGLVYLRLQPMKR